jgi:hypothetical protein
MGSSLIDFLAQERLGVVCVSPGPELGAADLSFKWRLGEF